MIGYCAEILLLQKEHFPLKNIHEKSGMLCQGLRDLPQEVQCDAPKTTLSWFGMRKMTTFKKEPKRRPIIKANRSSTI